MPPPRGGIQELRDRHMLAIAHYFHVRPWELDLLTVDQFLAMCESASRASEGGE